MRYIHQIQAVHQFVPVGLAYSSEAFQEPLSSLHRRPCNCFKKRKRCNFHVCGKFKTMCILPSCTPSISLLILWDNFEILKGCSWFPSLHYFFSPTLVFQAHRQCFLSLCVALRKKAVWSEWKRSVELLDGFFQIYHRGVSFVNASLFLGKREHMS